MPVRARLLGIRRSEGKRLKTSCGAMKPGLLRDNARLRENGMQRIVSTAQTRFGSNKPLYRKVEIEGGIGSLNRKDIKPMLKMTICIVHTSVKRQTLLQNGSTPSYSQKEHECRLMFNSTVIHTAQLRFDELPPKSIESFEDLRRDFLSYFLWQKKYPKDLVKLHHIKQREGEST